VTGRYLEPSEVPETPTSQSPAIAYWQYAVKTAEPPADGPSIPSTLTRWILGAPEARYMERSWLRQLAEAILEEAETTVAAVTLTPQALRVVFNELVTEWRSETKSESFPHRKAMHFAYQQIIGLGPNALPLILESLETDGGDWFWALIAITRIDVAEGISDVRDAAFRWLEWGRATRLLSVES